MRKLLVGLLVGGLLAVAAPAIAQPPQGGIGDPLTLAASGVLIPFVNNSSNGEVSLLEVASPVGNNTQLHGHFWDNTCKAGHSFGLPLTTNEIGFVQTFDQNLNQDFFDTSGLMTIAQDSGDGFHLKPLESPIHARVYAFNPSTGRSRVLEPIILDTAEFSGNPHTWSPLRTAATFFAPLETATVKTALTLLCPKSSLVDVGTEGSLPPDKGSTANGISFGGFPAIQPSFPSGGFDFHVRVYDTDEHFVKDFHTTCNCLVPDVLVTDLDPIYQDANLLPDGSYSEMEANPDVVDFAFTGYRSVFTSDINDFFSRLSNGSRASVQGSLSSER